MNKPWYEILHTLSNILIESVFVDAAIPKILRTVGEGLKWDFGEFWMVDPKANVLRRHAAVWCHPSKTLSRFSEMDREKTFQKGIGLPGIIWKAGEPYWVSEDVFDKDFSRSRIAAQEGLHGAIGFPVVSEDEAMGLFIFFHHKIPLPDKDLLRLLTSAGILTGRFMKRIQAEDLVKQKIRFEEGISRISYKLEKRILHMAYHDALTSLPNRNLFHARLEMATLHAKRDKKMAAIMAIDLDGFKVINDSFGHQTGDLLLKEAAVRMKECVRECDTVARFGGDEFMVILTNINHREDANHVAEKLLVLLSQKFLINNDKISITASIGISLYPADGNDMEDLIKKADNALYCSKKEGKNTYR